MKIVWDNIIDEVCDPANPNPTGSSCIPPGGGDGTVGGNGSDIPSTDERCGDPSFAAANPDRCRNYPRLILKPDKAIVEPGHTQQYSTYLKQGAKEILLTKGLVYTFSDDTVATISQFAGLATGVLPGQGTVAVTWQTLHAYAQLQVVASCADLHEQYVILIDNSPSSGQQFSNSYASKLSYAKAAANGFIDAVDFSRDSVAVVSFASAGVVVTQLVSTALAAKAAVNSVVVVSERTNLNAGLASAFGTFTQGNNVRQVVLIFSDGETNQGGDPTPEGTVFKNGFGVIVVVALRCWGQFFSNLYDLSSAGYFLSAHESTQQTTIDTLKGLKSFLCAGSCQQTSGTYPMAKLNYDKFINWNVTQGHVDLIGLGLWDVLPGNGLYVDIAGTVSNLPDKSIGELTSKAGFAFTAGHNYRFRISVAGNNVNKDGAYGIRVRVGAAVDQNIIISDKNQTLQNGPNPYTFLFTPGGSTTGNKIIITGLEQPVGRHPNVGLLFDNIVLEDLTSSTILLTDNFDNENPTTVTPDSSYGNTYGCLTAPPATQVADPTPPPTMIE